METYVVILVALIVLAIMDLTVGVANDAVNFLNSAIGSRAASFKVIMFVAALGVFAGVSFSGGMMEVARKGIFYPQLFNMPELMTIFVAVMFQDVLLLDTFNTFGLPTSTTVSIVFGLVGSSLAVSIIKITEAGGVFADISNYINTGNVLKIISAILLSIVLAFVVGSVVQYITRMIFTFDYKERFRKYGSMWGGLALTSLTFFIILKGTKGSVLMTPDVVAWIKGNLGLVFIYSFISWTAFLQLIMWFTKINVLKMIVLFGTFSLAMAFAANDLVNFIGAPLAGWNAFDIATADGVSDPLVHSMVDMGKKVKADMFILLGAGAVMVLALITSKKARSVAQTTISLGSQKENFERFESNALARALVRMVISVFDVVKKITPVSLQQKIAARFDLANYKPEVGKDGEVESFDLIRAAVILMVAAALISLATYFKLPLSTTYVTFIVAMAAALPDRAWGRESAVYRVSGVVTVIGGWFFTAFSASLVAMVIAFILYFGGLFAVFGMMGVVGFITWRSRKVHSDKEKEKSEREGKKTDDGKTSTAELVENAYADISNYLLTVNDIYKESCKAVFTLDLKALKKAKKRANKHDKNLGSFVRQLIDLLRYIDDNELSDGPDYARSISSFKSLAAKMKTFTMQNFNYFDNNHAQFMDVQIAEMKNINDQLSIFISDVVKYLNDKDNTDKTYLDDQAKTIKYMLKEFNQNQLKRMKTSTGNLRRSILFLSIISETGEIIDNTIRIATTSKEALKHVSKSVND